MILDEADTLLDMGFRPALLQIIRQVIRCCASHRHLLTITQLPSVEKRQTLLFSATFPDDVQSLASLALRRDHTVIDAIGESEQATNRQVDQVRRSSLLTARLTLCSCISFQT